MNQHQLPSARPFSLAAIALAASLTLAACGGGEVVPPPDTTPPTLAITDNVPGATTSGPVVFTFTFSEDVGSSFTAEDVVVTGGTAGAFAKVSATVYTLSVTPATNAAGSIMVSVAAGKFSDIALNANTAAASAAQAYDTTTPPASGDTVLLNFDDLLPISAAGGEGGDGSGVAVAPVGGGSGNAYRVLRSGGQVYALAVLEKVVPFTADRKTLSAMVYSPTAGIPMPIKMEGAGGVNTGDVQANQVVVVGWQTLTWTFSTANPATVYNKIVLLPNLGTVDAAPGKSYYFDDFKLKAAAVVTPPATGATLLLNFDDLLPISAAGGEGGDASGLAVAPAGGSGSGNAYRVLRSGGQVYALAVLEKVVPLTVDRKSISALVHSPTAGIPMVIKLETATGANTGDVQANETVVAGWQTLTWTFASANAALTYNKIVLLPNLGTVDAAPGKSYYFDDVKLLAASSGGGTVSGLPITFDGAGVTYTFTGFEGAEASTLAADPAGGSNMVGKVVRAAGGPWYGGTTVSTGANKSIATLPFTASAKTMKMRVYSPGAGMRVRMKVENASNPGVSCETDAVTVGTGWETLSFNFANPGLAPPVTGGPTTALNVAETYNKVTVFFNVAAAGSNWAGTYYFDDIAFGTP